MHVGTCRQVLRDLGCVGGLVVATLKTRKAAKDLVWAFPQCDQNTWVRCMCLETGGFQQRLLPDSVQERALNPRRTTASEIILYMGLSIE